MKSRLTFGVLLAASALACEEKRSSPPEPPVESTTTSPPPAKAQQVPGDASTGDAPDASTNTASSGATDAGARPRAERPLPKPQTMVRASMPIEVQQKAIMYMASMIAPHPGDANADPSYAEGLAERLKPITLSLDSGPNKATMNKVNVIAGGRQIDLLMSLGCNDKTPMRAVVQRAATPLATLASHGVFAIRCNDANVQCLQSTRDDQDVLCTTAKRHR